MKHKRFITVAVAAAFASVTAAWAESPSALLEKGIHAEETVGDMDAAIQIYNQIIAEAQANRSYVAQAYYRLGMCLLKKQDQAKAADAFKKVLTDFADQPTAFAKARREFVKLAPGDGPPVVLSTNPPAFADDVSPSLKKITVTFDRPMMDQSWSWTGGGETYPKTTGNPSYDATKMTCTLPVTLEPGKAYWVGVNSPSYNNFKTPDGVPAQRFAIPFATKSADGKSAAIPEDMAAEAKVINSGLGAKTKPQAKPLQIGPAPWQDGELMQLAIKAPAGGELGTLIWTAETATIDQKDIWRVQSYMTIGQSEVKQYTRVDAQLDSFVPLFGRTKNQTGDFRANYEANKVTLAVLAKGKETTRELNVSAPVYDNEEALYLIRRLPLAEGYCASFMIVPVQGGGTPIECRIEVTGKEDVTVPAGSYECLRMNLSVHVGKVQALKHQLWFSADKSKYLVKYDAGTAIMELTRAGTIDRDAPVSFEGNDLGVSLTAPAGWHFYTSPTPASYKAIVQLLPPELQAWCLLTVSEPEPASNSLTARQVADGDVEQLKGYFKGYAPRPDGWSDLTIAGMPASRFVADYENDGQKMVEYRTYLLGKSATYWFVFRIEKETFESMRPVFDSIMGSFEAK